jgi:hypothetical protein
MRKDDLHIEIKIDPPLLPLVFILLTMLVGLL